MDGSDAALTQRLARFLANRGATRELLLQTVGEPFGPPVVAVATGSVMHGVGNERSDLDVNVIVDHEVSRFPAASFAHRVLVDTTYFSVSEVERWVTMLRDQPWPPAGRIDRQLWGRYLDDLFECARFSTGLVLHMSAGWNLWLAELREPWLRDKVARWWHIEAIRRRLAARWLAHAKPLVAAQRLLEAVCAALESRVAAAGVFYFGPKWLSEKLCLLGDDEGLEAYRTILRVPLMEHEVAAYTARCEGLLERFAARDRESLYAQLSYLDGVRVHELDKRVMVSRWNLRGFELAGLAAPTSRELLWEGDIDLVPPAGVLTTFIEDMTWLSIAAKPS